MLPKSQTPIRPCRFADLNDPEPTMQSHTFDSTLGSPRRSFVEQLRRSSENDCRSAEFHVNTKEQAAQKKGKIY
jgi:hypothetical protein